MADPGLLLSIFPRNDDFESAAELESYEHALIIGYGNLGATKQPGEPSHAGNAGGASIWFSWRAPITGSVRFGLCQATFRPIMAVYTGFALQNLQTVAESDTPVSSGCLPADNKGGVAFNIDAGTVYRLAVDGFHPPLAQSRPIPASPRGGFVLVAGSYASSCLRARRAPASAASLTPAGSGPARGPFAIGT